MIEQNIPITHETYAIWLIFSGDKVLIPNDHPSLLKCAWHELGFAHAYKEQVVKIGTYDELPCLLIDMGNENVAQQHFSLVGLRSVLNECSNAFFEIAARSWQVALFIRTHRFCGQCGSKMQQVDWEMAMQCTRCQHRCYPRISPCVIVAIRHKDKILLAQGKSQKSREMYSIIAGFVESGETLEQAVHREVFEEVGVKITNLRYFASQPWPFPHALMMGYLADYDSGEIQVDGREILTADWFDLEHLPTTPSTLSIAGQLVESTKELMKNHTD
ncbi:NAD(+) diphosphatase [Paraglaciecola aquimarina]|uniref:NAD(+) diphosphatase n=1 Tax=Paraglaciecola aquimarina TaxID=1235557 RepID=A0ABU3ST27_9ALTE|nr:NAD(+) diphosphatase [Paraglaciecola aquimarina]MDU0353139.1 NAD(+) diphosphatase [Paraglaciecola aquimarina]